MNSALLVLGMQEEDMMGKSHSPFQRSNLAITVIGIALIILLGIVDYVTGPALSFSVFYLLPLSLITWFTNRRIGVIAAVICTLVWLLADLTTQPNYVHLAVPFWNAFVRFLVFIAIVYLESALKDLNREQEAKIEERTASLTREVTERKRAEEKLQEYTQWLEILHENDQAILAAQSLETIAIATMQCIKKLPSCDRTSLMVFDYAAKEIVMYDSFGDDKLEPVSVRRTLTDTLPDFSGVLKALQRESLQTGTHLPDVPLAASVADLLRCQDYRSLMILPVFVQDELIGSLNLMAFDSNVFSPEQMGIGRELASQLGIAFKQVIMLEQMKTDQENLQTLSKRLLGIQEAERRKIARELHDEVGQALTGIGLTLDMAVHLQTDLAADRLNHARALVGELMERVSSLSLELRPTLLDDLGLLPTLLWYADRYFLQTNILVNLRHSGLEERRFIPEIETAAYRIVQEGLTNVARHAQVSETKVALWCYQGILGIQIEDKGVGFDYEVAQSTGRAGGLLGMQERAWLLNGKLTIESDAGMGTRLLAEIPLNSQIVEQ